MSRKQENRKKGAAMFHITSETLRQFSLTEILLLIAMNIEASRLAIDSSAGFSTDRVSRS